MMPVQCANCKHYKSKLTCEAFPDGIPSDVVTTNRLHDKPIDGDDGIQFEQDKD